MLRFLKQASEAVALAEVGVVTAVVLVRSGVGGKPSLPPKAG